MLQNIRKSILQKVSEEKVEEQLKRINLVVLLTFLLAVIIGVIYYLTGDPGEDTLTQGTLIVNMMGKDLPYVEFLR